MHWQNLDRPKILRLLLFQMFRMKSPFAISEYPNFMAKSTLNKVLVSVATSQTAVSEQRRVHKDFPGSARCDTEQQGD